MEKKNYTRPIMGFERFLPNEYCNVCFSLHCYVAAGVPGYHQGRSQFVSGAYVEIGGNAYQIHGRYGDGTGCGHDDNQVIRISDSGEISVMEINTPDEIQESQLPAEFVNPRTLTEWNTTGTIGTTSYTYHHKGIAILNDTTKGPSHS